MNQQSINTFLTVAKVGSFTRASETLHLTQPAISKRIANLEQELGSVLFDRIGKEVKLTAAGEVFEHHAKLIAQAFQNCNTDLNNIQSFVTGKLNMGVSHHIGLHRLPPILQQFSEEYPRVQLSISFLDSDEAYKQVSQGSIEFALATLTERKQQYSSLQEEKLWQDDLLFVVNQQHPLTLLARNKILKLEDLLAFPAILPKASTYTGELVQKRFKEASLDVEQIIETNYLETIKMMTIIGLGWSVLPRNMIDQELVSLDIDNHYLSRNLGLIKHPERSLSNASKAFIEMLPQQVK